jgi:hypothetical protein
MDQHHFDADPVLDPTFHLMPIHADPTPRFAHVENMKYFFKI